MKISVVIPTLNEEAYIRAALVNCRSDLVAERIVVDGGSSDDTVGVARTSGAIVVRSPRGRAVQMNLGATHSSGSVLLFLHCDTSLPEGFGLEIARIFQDRSVLAGAFQLRIAGSARALRLIEKAVYFRSRFFNLPYGDQALFIRRETFYRLGGFKDVPIMEDFEMARRLRRVTHIGLSQLAVTTSARRWEKLGPWKTTAINQLLIAGYLVGIPPERLLRFYRR